jgi:conjugative relaxase-like TrwC/TraI family protein
MMFFRHFKNSQDAKDYYAHLSHDDYFAKDAPENRPTYQGKTAELLGISGMEATKESFYALCDNRHPITGEKLTSRDKDDRRILTDMTFDVPKAVTEAVRKDKRVKPVLESALRETLTEMQEDMCVRVRKGGRNEDRVSGNMLYVIWPHETTRPLDDGTVDPHKHWHVTVLNASFDPEEKRLKACQFGNIVRDKAYYQAAWHARVARPLSELGYGIEKDGNSFTLAGIARSIVEKFSRRTGVIEAEAERKGITDEAVKAGLGAKTRNKKSKVAKSMSELHAEWDSRLTPEERLAIQTAGSGFARGDDPVTPDQAKQYALEHSFERASAVSEKRLKAEALTYGVGSIRPEDVADIADHPEVIARKHAGQLMATTKTVLRDEVSMLQFAQDGQRKFRPFTNSLSTSDLEGLIPKQRDAVLHIVNSRDQVTGMIGKAGTGKTHTLKTAISAIGWTQVLAPSASVADMLRKDGFPNVMTLQRFLLDEKAQEAAKGKPLLAEEAGLVSSRDMRRLFDVAKKNGNRVIVSGDPVQHSSVEAGDAFRLLEKEGGVRLARLTQIMRQEAEQDRKAIEAFSQGTEAGTKKGYDLLVKSGRVIEIADDDDLRKRLVNEFAKLKDTGETPLVITPTHARAALITAELRARLKDRGELGEEREFNRRRALGWTTAEKGDARNYEAGMVVEFHQNAKGFTRGERAVVAAGESGGLTLLTESGTRKAIPHTQADRFEVYKVQPQAIAARDQIRITKNGLLKVEGQARGTPVNNGDIYPVEGFTKEGHIRLPGGKIMPKDFGHFTLGYVSTSQGSQGKTRHHELVDWSSSTLVATDRKAAYVTPSRFVKSMQAFVNDKREAREHLSRGGDRLSAVELTQTRLRTSWKERLQKSFERSRVGRFLKERAAAVADYRSRGKEGMSRV